MIVTWEKHIIYVMLHDKKKTDYWKENYPNKPQYWNCTLSVDIEDVYRIEKTDDGRAIIWVPRDDQGGGKSVEVLEDYDELYELLTSKSERLKRILKK